MRQLFRIRDARVLLLGWGLSMLGDTAMFLVLGIWAKDLTHSNAAAGLVFFVLILPSLFAPFAGLVVDRVRKKPLLIGVNCVMAAAVLLLLFVHDRGDLWLIYIVAGLYGTASVILGSARSAFLTVMLPRELLGEANAVFATLREGLRLISPLLGAGLYAAFGGGVVAIADALTFVGVAVALLFVRTSEARLEREDEHFLTELAAGVRHIYAIVSLKQIVLATAACLLVVGFSETLFFAVVEFGLHRPPSFLVIPFAPHGHAALALLIPTMLIGGFMGVVYNIAQVSLRQAITPERIQGRRVASAANTMVSTPQTIGIALGAVLISVLDYRLLVAVMFVAIAACGAYLLTRGPEPLTTQEPALDLQV